MKRKAILIESSNVTGQDDLPGARVDIQNWVNFLTSALGGAWLSHEIVTMSKPTSAEVKKEIEVDLDCYSFVAFSGHGRDGTVVLNEYWDDFPISSLRPKSRQGTMIVDSCRGLDEGRPYSFSRTAILASESVGREVVMNSREGRSTKFASYLTSLQESLSNHKASWGTSLSSSAAGVVEMLACAKGQGAGEDPKAGGYYTALLLQSADIWQQGTTTNGIHTTKNAHDHAAKMLPAQQTPEYKPQNLAFPFAVRA